MLLDQGQKCHLPSQCTGSGIQSRLRAPGFVYIKVYCLCNSWSWRLAPCYRQLGSSIHYHQVGGMVLIQPSPHPSSIVLVHILNSRFVFFIINTGL